MIDEERFEYFSAACWAWKQTVSQGTRVAARLLSMLSKSCSAFSSQARYVDSGCFIQHPAFVLDAFEQRASQVAKTLDFLRRVDDYIQRPGM